jgi:hypothetical protein
VKRGRAIDGLLDCGVLVRNRRRYRDRIGFEIPNGRLERGDSGGVVGHSRLLCVGCLLCLGCCRLCVGCRLLRLLQLDVLVRQIGLQAIDLTLELLAQLLNLVFNGGLWGLLGYCFLLRLRRGVACIGIRADKTDCQNCSGSSCESEIHWASLPSSIGCVLACARQRLKRHFLSHSGNPQIAYERRSVRVAKGNPYGRKAAATTESFIGRICFRASQNFMNI